MQRDFLREILAKVLDPDIFSEEDGAGLIFFLGVNLLQDCILSEFGLVEALQDVGGSADYARQESLAADGCDSGNLRPKRHKE